MQRRLRVNALLIAAGLTSAVLVGVPAAHAAADPLSMTNGFYVDPHDSAAVWAAANPGDGRRGAIVSSIASEPAAAWFTGASGDIGQATGAYVGAAGYADKLPVLVAYNITDRDICSGQSVGGAPTDAAYDTWIGAFAGGIADRPALVILEPDAVGDESCMTSAEIADRNGLLNNAVTQFANQSPNTFVYLDAGNPGWLSASTMASSLNSAGLESAHGFSLNVSNFYTTAQNVAYGNAINAYLSAHYGYTKPFVIDTSRNGNGGDGQWCNPGGAKLGATDQVGGGAEMLLWIKDPGESDGDCGSGTGTVAGQFDPQLAYNLVYGY
jgi:endoglucanase